jgi:hypothetical protein
MIDEGSAAGASAIPKVIHAMEKRPILLIPDIPVASGMAADGFTSAAWPAHEY